MISSIINMKQHIFLSNIWHHRNFLVRLGWTDVCGLKLLSSELNHILHPVSLKKKKNPKECNYQYEIFGVRVLRDSL